MLSTGRYGAAIAIIAGGLLSSCAQSSRDPVVDPHILADAEPPIKIEFTCNGANKVGLTGKNGVSAWTFKAKKKDPVSWLVEPNVAINGISAKLGESELPLSSDGASGGANGTPYQTKVKDNADLKTYHYNIEVTCTPTIGGGNPVRLTIDPDMIIF